MEIGITGMFGSSPRRDMGFVREYAACCESVGFAALYLPEHVVFFSSYRSAYPYTQDGSTNWGPDTGIYDPLITATVAAGVTDRLRLVTSILILPERPALLTAKEVMSVDHTCRGSLRARHRGRLVERGVCRARRALGRSRAALRRVHRGDARGLAR